MTGLFAEPAKPKQAKAFGTKKASAYEKALEDAVAFVKTLRRFDARNQPFLNDRLYDGYLIVDEKGFPYQAAYRCQLRFWGDGYERGFDNLVCWLKPEFPTPEMTAWFNIVRKANA